ncbi:MAG: DUF4178 domain-containing protein [Cyanobacteria bacterium REEB67]|nr:DUF4178 domain-containing protein [Cyanobacteria bacterium REEB67]
MQTLSCPSCGANVNFVSKASVFAVCSYCKSSLVRQGIDLEAVGKIAELSDDLTPIQIGTTFTFENENFDVIGRMKVAYTDGFWNEWFTVGSKGRLGWLVEAQGFWGMCFPCLDIVIPDQAGMAPGKSVDFGMLGYFQVEDVHKVKCVYSEGELPVNAVQGRESLSVDLTGEKGAMATIEYAERERRVFCGAYQDFDLFQFKNLRAIDGW